MDHQRMRFAIGLVTLIAGFALAAIIIWFGEFQFVLQPRRVYYVTFNRAPGVAPKVPVRRAGIRIGEVRDVEFSEERSLVVCTILLEGDQQLRYGDEPTLNRSLLGDTYLDIEIRPDAEGRGGRAVIPPGTVMEGRTPPDILDSFTDVRDLLPRVEQALVEIETTSRQWTQVGSRLDRMLASNEENVNSALDQVDERLGQLGESLESVNALLSEENRALVQETLENLNQTSKDVGPLLEQLQETAESIDVVARNLEKATGPLADRGEKITANVDRVAANVAWLTDELRGQDGTIQRLLSDPSLYDDVQSATRLLNENLLKLRKIVDDVRVFADKIARHPGELGVQGVFSRDDGLKTAPPDMEVPHTARERRPTLFGPR